MFRYSECEFTAGDRSFCLPFCFGESLLSIGFYEIDDAYIDYLARFEPHLFHTKQSAQHNERKYIGVLLTVNGMDYFAPLSSFKPKHEYMKEGLDFLKIGNYAVMNLNNMFPAARKYCRFVDFSKERNLQYKKLLESEYRIIRVRQNRILKNAATLYNYKLKNGDSTALGKRCNDFLLLERKASEYKG